MNLPRRQISFRERDFHSAWSSQATAGPFWQSRTRLIRKAELLNAAAHFVGGALLADGFSLFHNGGLPLIERREGLLIEEILLRPGNGLTPDGLLPVRVTVHLNHLGLQASRMRYWPSPTRAPSVIASMDVGQLEIPPCWPIWILDGRSTEMVDIVDWIQRLALPWFDLFTLESELRRRLFLQTVPLVGLDTSLELVIAEYGPLEGARFLDQCVLSQPNLGGVVREKTLRILRAKEESKVGANLESTLSAVAASFRLISR